MIAYRHADRRFPFLWETDAQPPARWHGEGEGPVAYLASSPDAAWAELLRHEEIASVAELEGIARSMWAIELPDFPAARPVLPEDVLTGGRSSWPDCRREAARLRAGGHAGFVAPSAALRADAPDGFFTAGGLRPAAPAPAQVIVLFGPRPDLRGWCACDAGRPRADLLRSVVPLGG